MAGLVGLAVALGASACATAAPGRAGGTSDRTRSPTTGSSAADAGPARLHPGVPSRLRLEVSTTGPSSAGTVLLGDTRTGKVHSSSVRLPWAAEGPAGSLDRLLFGVRGPDRGSTVRCRVLVDGLLLVEQQGRGGTLCVASISDALVLDDPPDGSLTDVALTSVPTTDVPPATALPPEPRHVRLSVSSAGTSTASIDWATDESAPHDEADQPLPYSVTLPWQASTPYRITAVGRRDRPGDPIPTLSCTVQVDGVLVERVVGLGAASCSSDPNGLRPGATPGANAAASGHAEPALG